jgi:ribosome-associated translation inhibitor RaiA/cold shock CspA family protein
MQVPLEIAFHNLDKEPWAENEIRARVRKLEKLFERIIACRVRVDQRANASRGATPPVVRIEISMPGNRDIIVSHEPDHLIAKFQNPDLKNAIAESFHLAERQLIELKDKLQGRTKAHLHDGPNQSLGQVAELYADQDHGFLVTKEGGLLYFHRNAVLSGDFDALKRGAELYYVEDVGDTGPIATKVRAKAAS